MGGGGGVAASARHPGAAAVSARAERYLGAELRECRYNRGDGHALVSRWRGSWAHVFTAGIDFALHASRCVCAGHGRIAGVGVRESVCELWGPRRQACHRTIGCRLFLEGLV